MYHIFQIYYFSYLVLFVLSTGLKLGRDAASQDAGRLDPDEDAAHSLSEHWRSQEPERSAQSQG